MKKEYDFSKMNAVKNPYAKILKKQVTIRLNSNTIEYFKVMAKEVGIPYQVLIDSYLTDCA
ncbi:MAG: CopG family antitoxin, partial [Fibrobacter sp.]|nr:CopG family antitoxin [Fibrobacter sp.]